jgi:hypothetical protein
LLAQIKTFIMYLWKNQPTRQILMN